MPGPLSSQSSTGGQKKRNQEGRRDMLERYLSSEPTMTEKLARLGHFNSNADATASSGQEQKGREEELKEFVRMWQQSWEASEMKKET